MAFRNLQKNQTQKKKNKVLCALKSLVFVILIVCTIVLVVL